MMEPLNILLYSGKAMTDAVPIKTAKGKTYASFDLVQTRTAPGGEKVEKTMAFWVGEALAPEVLKRVKQHEAVVITGRLSSNAAGLVAIVDVFRIVEGDA